MHPPSSVLVSASNGKGFNGIAEKNCNNELIGKKLNSSRHAAEWLTKPNQEGKNKKKQKKNK